MSNFVIFTDSACDISPEMLKEWGVQSLNLTFRFEGEDKEYSNDEMDVNTFYDRMRAGGVAKTAAINADSFENAFEVFLKDGVDVLYLGFSSGLSTTYNSSRIAAEELRDRYPDRKIVVVDTLSASAGQGLLVYLTVQKKNSGATIEETAAYAENMRLNISHWFTVDDLVYLKRGGRVSAAAAFVGGALGIKPVLHVDNEGHLINMSKVRGRKNALTALADKFGELAEDKENNTVFISHGDCLEDANTVASIIKERYGATVNVISDIGPVIGAHTGPGVLAFFFVGKER